MGKTERKQRILSQVVQNISQCSQPFRNKLTHLQNAPGEAGVFANPSSPVGNPRHTPCPVVLEPGASLGKKRSCLTTRPSKAARVARAQLLVGSEAAGAGLAFRPAHHFLGATPKVELFLKERLSLGRKELVAPARSDNMPKEKSLYITTIRLWILIKIQTRISVCCFSILKKTN